MYVCLSVCQSVSLGTNRHRANNNVYASHQVDHLPGKMVSLQDDEPAELSESLVGLVGAFDRLRAEMGLEGPDESYAESMLEIESYVSGIRDENEEIRLAAEEAITMAQKYKAAYEELAEENAGLLEQVTQAKLGDMVAQTQELTAAAYEFDKEMFQMKVAQAEEMTANAWAVQDRLDELEEENKALNQVVHELREDQKQWYALRQLNGMPAGGIDDGDAELACGSPVAGSPTAAGAGAGAQTPAGAIGEDGVDDGSDGDETASNQYATPGSAARSIRSHMTPKSPNDDPIALADALAAVAKGSESGMAASASKMLRSYHVVQAELEELRTRNAHLAKENDEMTEMMTSKQFKAPSAWAEREVKHKLEQKEWEERDRAKDVTIKELEAENASLRTTEGTAGLQERIVDLEAQLVVSRRECADSKAALHEMRVSSMMTTGEFSMAGVKPLGDHDDVHSMVDKIESESESSGVSGAHVGAKRQRQLEQELENLHLEKATILGDLEAVQADIARSRVTVAKSEIALLENGVSVEMASKILELEGIAGREDAEGADNADNATSSLDMEGAAADMGDAMKAARRTAASKGDEEAVRLIDGLRVASYVEGAGDADGGDVDGDDASDRLEISTDAQDRIEQLQADMQGLLAVVDNDAKDSTRDAKDRSDTKDPKDAGETSSNPGRGMQPRAAAALAAINRGQEQDLARLKRQLADAVKREAELQQKLTEPVKPVTVVPPVRLDLNVLGSPGKATAATAATSTTSTAMTPLLTPGGLALARKDADQAWEDHQKKTDLTAILREKAQIEARFDLTKSQLTKSQQALDMARQDAAAMRKAIKQAVATGDVKAVQKALDEASKSSSLKKASSPLKRLKGRGIFSLKKSSSTSGANSNSSSRPGSGEADDPIPNVRLKSPTGGAGAGAGAAGSSTPGRDKFDEDGDVAVSREIENLHEENEMLMDQLVSTKVRLAEVEGECLQSRRALVRAKEKQMDLNKQLKGLRAGPLERG